MTPRSATRSTATVSSAGWLGEHEASQVVAERVLLPVDEVVFWRNCQRISQYRRAAVGSRPQAHDMGRKAYRPVEAVRHVVLQGDPYAHTRQEHRRGRRRRRRLHLEVRSDEQFVQLAETLLQTVGVVMQRDC